MKIKKYTSLELFAGAGGLALGLEKAGFESVGVLENNKWAASTLRANRPQWNIIEKDVVVVASNGVKEHLPKNIDLDLLSGGYPCQSFSYAGKQLGFGDIRGTLFSNFAQILKETQPKMFLAENVKGLTTHDKGQTLATMISVFEKEGYVVSYKVLNALNFNVAQKRERIAIIGVRQDIQDKIGEPFLFPTPLNKKLTIKDVLKNVPTSLCASYPVKKQNVFKLVSPGGCWRDLPEDVAKEYMGGSYLLGGGKTGMARKLSWDEPGLTVLCSPAQKQTDRCHPDELRPFSVRENARIQSFPDAWTFIGSMAEQYKQIGNAVPVNLAEAIGKSIIQHLNKIPKKIT